MLLPKRWQSCMMLLIFVLSDGTGTTKQSIAATAAVCGKDLQPRSRVLMGFASLADTMNASGLVFCVANPSADANALRNGLDWACGPGGANCTAIQPGQPCYEPNNLTALASYAYNDYYQRTRASGGSCSFNNTAMTTTSDPSKRPWLMHLHWKCGRDHEHQHNHKPESDYHSEQRWIARQ
ncbi:glucan endo-1,3-beta-glucosidase 4-like isoform X3 [Musa acuminata AAA Group]|uniref:glucan endo-1,3-beta-glucosidase 4-like isoform X3 n=1 Tax=Musa acuminata AAA Group TaxID=214697 RepID=UPI0031DB9679